MDEISHHANFILMLTCNNTDIYLLFNVEYDDKKNCIYVWPY